MFKNFISNLTESLLTKLPNSPDRCNWELLPSFAITDYFCFSNTSKTKYLKVIQKIEISKAAGIDKFSRWFLRAEAKVLSRPISEIFNLSISRGVLPDACQFAKQKHIYRKRKKTEPFISNTDLFLYF